MHSQGFRVSYPAIADELFQHAPTIFGGGERRGDRGSTFLHKIIELFGHQSHPAATQVSRYKGAQMDSYALLTPSNLLGVLVLWLVATVLYRRLLHPLAGVPGPFLAAITPLYGFYFNAVKGGRFYLEIERLHRVYGLLTRISLILSHYCPLGRLAFIVSQRC